MRRRDFISILGASVYLMRTINESQSKIRNWRVGVITAYAPNDTEIQPRLNIFTDVLRSLDAQNKTVTNIFIKSASGNTELMKNYAREIVGQHPDAILSATTPATAAIINETTDIPVVFVSVSDPVGSGFVKHLSRPDKNVTGFINTDPTLCVKWVEMLKEVVPSMSYVAIMYNPQTAPYSHIYIDHFKFAAHALKLEADILPINSEKDIASAILGVSQRKGGIILMNDSFITNNRILINSLTQAHKVPTMSYNRHITANGGLISYGVDEVNLYSRAAHYIYRILSGEKVYELPVQMPEVINLSINMNTAKLLEIQFPNSILIQANEIFE